MIKNKKISKSFIAFLVASILIWFLITFSKDYTTTLTFPVNYSNIPQDKLLQKEPTKEIDIIVKTSGFNIIRTRFSDHIIDLNANLLKKKSLNKYYFLIKNQSNTIQKQLPSDIQIQEIVLDSIYLEIGSLASKKVPLKANLEINYQVGYDILAPVSLKPDSIIISGPETQINKINVIDLNLLKLENVNTDFFEKVNIVLPINSSSLKVNTTSTIISGKVEKFTEGTLTIPFKVKNLPKDVELTMLDKTVEVVFVVGLSNFNKIDKSFFEVECDFNISKENNLGYLVPTVVAKSDFIKSFKVVPNKIDFLIQK